jgi:hypothetical protein
LSYPSPVRMGASCFFKQSVKVLAGLVVNGVFGVHMGDAAVGVGDAFGKDHGMSRFL